MFSHSNIDPELETLRNEILNGISNSNRNSSNIKQETSKIHAAYIFHVKAMPILQNLCLLLSSTASGKSYGDWQKFAVHLGLSNEQIKCIEYDFKGLQDPTYYVLLAYVQSNDANINKIFTALESIERFDIISQINQCSDILFQIINEEKSEAHMASVNFYFPECIPKAPLVLSPAKGDIQNQNLFPIIQNSQFTSQNRKKLYKSIVMLTFIEADINLAHEIAKIFRSPKYMIGVLILQEQEKHILSKSEEFVEDCYKQSNYIIPILTKKYIKNLQMDMPINAISSLDSRYMRYIFSLIRYEYVTQNCLNNRVRCIIPDEEIDEVIAMDLHPTLQAWFKKSDINNFAEKIVLNAI